MLSELFKMPNQQMETFNKGCNVDERSIISAASNDVIDKLDNLMEKTESFEINLEEFKNETIVIEPDLKFIKSHSLESIRQSNLEKFPEPIKKGEPTIFGEERSIPCVEVEHKQDPFAATELTMDEKIDKQNQAIESVTQKNSESYNVESETVEDDNHKNCPVNDGKWTNDDGSEGERGESKWVPDSDYVPQKSNPEGKTWGDIMSKHNIDGIKFNDGEPDFSEISKADIEVENFSTNRSDNFDQADAKLAEQWGCEPEDVAQWRSDNHYTWHECCDMKTMQLVPSEVHNNITHRGGISNAKGA